MFEDETVDNSEGATTSTNDDNGIASQDALESSSDSSVDNAQDNGETKEGDAGPKTMKEAIAAALREGSEESEEESPASAEDQEKQEAAKSEADNARLDKNPRFQEVIAERDKVRNELKEFEPVREIIKNSGLSNDDFAATLQLGADYNRVMSGEKDPVELLNLLVPIVQNLQSVAGFILPGDLQQAVQEGQISKQYAQDLAKQRIASAAAENRTQKLIAAQQAEEQNRQNQQIEVTRQNVHKATNDWEAKQKSIDPDYEQKRQLVYNNISAVIAQKTLAGQRVSPQEAIQICNASYEKVNGYLSGVLPRRNGGNKSMPGGAPSSKIVVKPATRKEAIAAALRGE